MRTLIALFLLAAPVYAQKKQPAPQPAAKHVDIDEDEVVEGGVASGSGDIVGVLKHKRFEGMIKIRQDFKPEMYVTALNL